MIEVYVDGSCRGNGSEVAIGGSGVVITFCGVEYCRLSKRYTLPITNNEAEYFAVIEALKLLDSYKLNREKIIIYSDSKLVVNQVLGNWQIKEPKLKPYVSQIRNKFRDFYEITMEWIPRAKNKIANDLAQSITEEI